MNRWLRWWLSLVLRGTPAGPRLVILRHHRVYGDDERPLYRLGVSASVFDAQLALLERMRLTPIGVADGLAWLSTSDHGLRVALSFDDGYADNVDRALPLLRARGGRATFFLTAGWIDQRVAPWWDQLAHSLESARRRDLVWAHEGASIALALGTATGRGAAFQHLLPLMRALPEVQQRRLRDLADAVQPDGDPKCELATWEQARALAASGMEIGAHTLTHPLLGLLSPERQEAEIGGSIDLIASKLGVRPGGLAYPQGDHDGASVAACARHGLRYAVTTGRGDVRPGDAPFELRRRGWSDGACLDPFGRFSASMARAEVFGAFDQMRNAGAEGAS